MAATAIETLPVAKPALGLGDQEVLALDAVASTLVRRTTGTLLKQGVAPGLDRVVHEAASYAVGFARAGVLLHDRSVVSSHLGWLEAFVSARGLHLSGADLLEAVDGAGGEVLDDPCVLHDVIAG